MIPTIRPTEPEVKFDAREFLLLIPWKFLLQRLPGVMLLLCIPFTLLGPIYFPFIFMFYYFLMHGMYLVNMVRSCYGVYIGYTQALAFSTTNWLQKYMERTGTSSGSDTRHDLAFDSVLHVIIIPNYKEDFGTLGETLDILASHERALSQYRICLAMEQAEQGCEEKAKKLIADFQYLFYDIRYTVHPKSRPGEIRGKSSNVAWAAEQMSFLSSRHDHEILTVMDADTAFAADYFMAITYFYCVAPPSHRKIMMFTPTTVFDRNAHKVPIFVRGTDLFWSMSVLSNLYPGSPIKIPCSAYSISMNLVLAVNFWDTGPQAVGEDMHMYLKCFFETEGKLIVRSIFSPSSNCNIEGEGSGVVGYVNNIQARYLQSKRHLWGSLDFGYSLKRCIFTFAQINETLFKTKNTSKSVKSSQYAHLIHRLAECHLLPGQMFTSVLLSGFIPLPNAHPIIPAVLAICGWIRVIGAIFTVLSAYYYEKYHDWVGFGRWKQLEAQKLQTHSLQNEDDELLKAEPKVQNLGKRPQLSSQRTFFNALDWFIITVSGFIFGAIPQYHAQIGHFFTDNLDYKVAQKPVVSYQQLIVEDDAKSAVSKGDEGYFEGDEPRSIIFQC